MKTTLRVLIVEDSEFDARVMVNVLRGGSYNPIFRRVETDAQMREALKEQEWDVILADYNLPEFSAPLALKVAQELSVDLPFIIVSGGIGEDIAVECMKAGAHDYLMKGNLARLLPAVEREIREASNRSARRQAEDAMRESELRYRLLWETCPDAVILMDPQGYIQFVNPAVEQVFGYKPAELLGVNLSILQPKALIAAHNEGLDRYLKTGQKIASWTARQSVGRRKDGKEIIIEISVSDMVLQGQRRFVGFIRDITERKRAEAVLQENLEQFRLAREIQQRLFPDKAPDVAGYEVAGASFPAEAAGGDYFDYLTMLNGRIGLVVGDVTGHGIGPAMLMAETRAYLRLLSFRREDVGEILTIANRVISEDVGFERFVTLMLVRIEPTTRTLMYASAGHPAGYLFNSAGEIKQVLKRTGVPLGIRANTTYETAPPITMETGDLALLLTDGIEEAMGPDNSFFGIERALDYVRENRHLPAASIVNGLYQVVREFSQGITQLDDVTAIIVKVK
jgi:PAS domain S-box-containing protein